jgi:DNA-directed RNA polymerase alpha subunit
MMVTEKQYLKALAIVKAYQKQINEQVDNVAPKTEMQDWKIEDLDISVRAFNVIVGAIRDVARKERDQQGVLDYLEVARNKQGSTLKEVADYITIRDLRNVRNCGIKTMEEIKNVFAKCGLKLKAE